MNAPTVAMLDAAERAVSRELHPAYRAELEARVHEAVKAARNRMRMSRRALREAARHKADALSYLDFARKQKDRIELYEGEDVH